MQDNQVSEWSEHYIAYHELKALLKKVKQAIARYEDQAKKKPALAKEIKINYDQGIHSYITKTPPMSSTSLVSLGKELSGNSLHQQQQQQKGASSKVGNQKDEKDGKDAGEASSISETTSLLQKFIGAAPSTTAEETKQAEMATPSSYGGVSEDLDSPTSTSGGVHSVLNKAVSSVSGYFEKRYETNLRDYLREIDSLQDDFDHRMEKEVSCVDFAVVVSVCIISCSSCVFCGRP